MSDAESESEAAARQLAELAGDGDYGPDDGDGDGDGGAGPQHGSAEWLKAKGASLSSFDMSQRTVKAYHKKVFKFVVWAFQNVHDLPLAKVTKEVHDALAPQGRV